MCVAFHCDFILNVSVIFHVVRAQAVQLGMQGLDGMLGQAVLLGAAGWVNGWAGPAVEGVG